MADQPDAAGAERVSTTWGIEEVSDKIFVNGMVVKRNDSAPEYVTCNVSINWDEFEVFCKQQPGKWKNIVIKRAKSGKYYAELDTWKPPEKLADVARTPVQATAEDDSEIPF